MNLTSATITLGQPRPSVNRDSRSTIILKSWMRSDEKCWHSLTWKKSCWNLNRSGDKRQLVKHGDAWRPCIGYQTTVSYYVLESMWHVRHDDNLSQDTIRSKRQFVAHIKSYNSSKTNLIKIHHLVVLGKLYQVCSFWSLCIVKSNVHC